MTAQFRAVANLLSPGREGGVAPKQKVITRSEN
jgi:hypothetical protein